MRGAVRTGVWVLALAMACGLAKGQQSNGATTNGASTSGGKKSAPGAVKQEFGPQTMPRRGDRMTAVKPGEKAGSDGSQSATGAGQSGKTQKLNVKQEFGPQTVSRRGDRMTTIKPGGQGSSRGAGASGTAYRQEFGQTQVTKRNQTVRHRSRDHKSSDEGRQSK